MSKRKRGVSRSLALEKRIKAEGKISNLRIPQDKWGPVGKDAGVFTSEVGVVCRMFTPLSVSHWSDMTDEDKDPMFVRLAARSKASAQNRSHLKVLHYSGSKSFLWHREELENAEIGRIEFCRQTHSKDGSWTSLHAEEFYLDHVQMRMMELMRKVHH